MAKAVSGLCKHACGLPPAVGAALSILVIIYDKVDGHEDKIRSQGPEVFLKE